MRSDGFSILGSYPPRRLATHVLRRKERYEEQALSAEERHHRDLTEYEKTESAGNMHSTLRNSKLCSQVSARIRQYRRPRQRFHAVIVRRTIGHLKVNTADHSEGA